MLEIHSAQFECKLTEEKRQIMDSTRWVLIPLFNHLPLFPVVNFFHKYLLSTWKKQKGKQKDNAASSSTGMLVLETRAAVSKVWLSWSCHLVGKPRGHGETTCRNWVKGSSDDASLLPSSHSHFFQASQQKSQTSQRRDKPSYFIVTEFQAHSIHGHNTMVVSHYHIKILF